MARTCRGFSRDLLDCTCLSFLRYCLLVASVAMAKTTAKKAIKDKVVKTGKAKAKALTKEEREQAQLAKAEKADQKRKTKEEKNKTHAVAIRDQKM